MTVERAVSLAARLAPIRDCERAQIVRRAPADLASDALGGDGARLLGRGPEEMLHQLTGLGGERHAEVFGRMKLLPIALAHEGEQALFERGNGCRGVMKRGHGRRMRGAHPCAISRGTKKILLGTPAAICSVHHRINDRVPQASALPRRRPLHGLPAAVPCRHATGRRFRLV